MSDIVYNASFTARKFHKDDNFVRAIMGPVGSGKSVACCCEAFRRAQEQAPGPDGIRRTRAAMIRNTYKELKFTTLKTWEDWFGSFGTLNKSDMIFTVELNDVHCEVIFLALDRPQDIARLLSLELTFAFVNEAREIPKSVIDMLCLRVGRYPSARDGGPTWHGVIMDTNPPDVDHWWYRIFEEACPVNWSLYKQPSGISEKAENVDNLPDGYYTDMMSMQGEDWLRVYRDGQYGFVRDGKPVYPEYNDNVHAGDVSVAPGRIYVGIDFGLTPAATFGQRDAMGKWSVIDELVTFDMGAIEFGELLGQRIRERYPNHELTITGDPAGDQRSQVDSKTPFQALSSVGIRAHPANTNDPMVRREAVASYLRKMVSGSPALIVDGKACPTLRKGLGGGYQYKRVQVSGDERYKDEPDKNKYSHVCDAMQYMMLGAGEGANVLRSTFEGHQQGPIQAVPKFNLYG